MYQQRVGMGSSIDPQVNGIIHGERGWEARSTPRSTVLFVDKKGSRLIHQERNNPGVHDLYNSVEMSKSMTTAFDLSIIVYLSDGGQMRAIIGVAPGIGSQPITPTARTLLPGSKNNYVPLLRHT